MNTNPGQKKDQLAIVRSRIEGLKGTPGPIQEIAFILGIIVEHAKESDGRIAQLESRLRTLSPSSK
jgi:hypothetical protein